LPPRMTGPTRCSRCKRNLGARRRRAGCWTMLRRPSRPLWMKRRRRCSRCSSVARVVQAWPKTTRTTLSPRTRRLHRVVPPSSSQRAQQQVPVAILPTLQLGAPTPWQRSLARKRRLCNKPCSGYWSNGPRQRPHRSLEQPRSVWLSHPLPWGGLA